jgi:hypothetical protein
MTTGNLRLNSPFTDGLEALSPQGCQVPGQALPVAYRFREDAVRVLSQEIVGNPEQEGVLLKIIKEHPRASWWLMHGYQGRLVSHLRAEFQEALQVFRLLSW